MVSFLKELAWHCRRVDGHWMGVLGGLKHAMDVGEDRLLSSNDKQEDHDLKGGKRMRRALETSSTKARCQKESG